MILAPRSWPSSPGLATTTRIFFSDEEDISKPAERALLHDDRHLHVRMQRAVQVVGTGLGERVGEGAVDLSPGLELGGPAANGDVVSQDGVPLPGHAGSLANRELLGAEEVVL